MEEDTQEQEPGLYVLMIEEWDGKMQVTPHFQKGPLEDRLQEWVKRPECKSARLYYYSKQELIALVENPKPPRPKGSKFH